MDAIDLLLSQHAKARELMDDVKGASGAAQHVSAEELATDLAIHMEIEEQIFYPACRRAGLDDLLGESFAEHAKVKKALTRLVALEEEGPEFDRLFDEISQDVLHHVEEEEDEMFPKMREKFSADELAQLGSRMETLAAELADADPIERLEDSDTGARI